MTKAKKAQAVVSGSSAATFVAILALMVILYILFLPPGDREQLLNGDSNSDSDNNNGDSNSVNQSLLLIHPGTIDFLEVKEYEHDVPTFNLNAEPKPTSIKKIDSFAVTHSWFGEKPFATNFEFADLPNTNNVILSFNVKSTKGILAIKLNGEEIYSGIAEGTVTLMLEKSRLKEKNSLEFNVGGPGFKFWSTNEYVIEGFRLAADVIDKAGLTAESAFMMTTTEKDNVEKSYLRFFADCKSEEIGRLDISINNHGIYSSGVDCGGYAKVEFAPTYLRSGENVVSFNTDKGSYLLDRVMVKTELKDVIYPTYHFEITSKQFENVADNDKDAVLRIDFVDDVDYKKANIFINGHETFLDQREINYTKVLDPFVRKGDNALEIIPKSRLNMATIKVSLENN